MAARSWIAWQAKVASGGTLDVQFPVTLRPSTGTDLFTSGPYEPRLDVSRSIQGSYRATGGSRLGFKLEGFRWTVTSSNGDHRLVPAPAGPGGRRHA